MRNTQKGFTLLELMIVVAVIALLAAIALPMYTEQVRKGKRAEAVQALGDIQLRQERWRADHPSYGVLNDLFGTATNASNYNGALKNFTVSISGPGAGGVPDGTDYVLTATRKNDLAADPKCANFVIRFGSLCDGNDAPGVISKCMSDNQNVDYCWRR